MDMQLAIYAREAFGAQAGRRFVFGFTLCRTELRVWLFDRAGRIGSKSFDITTDKKLFVRIFANIAIMDRDDARHLGYDPTIRLSGDTKYIRVGNEEFVLGEKIFSRSVIAGRATTCWWARRKDGNPLEWPFVIKDSWRQATREPEGPLLLHASEMLRQYWNDPTRPHVADCLCHDVVQIDGRPDDVYNCIRRRLGPTLHDTSTSLQSSDSKEVNRIHSRIVLKTYGRPIYEFTDLRELLVAFRDALRYHDTFRTHSRIYTVDPL